ncbi:MAG: AraC family transcriptional regulator [Bacteroidales bacterium]|nr:AraC family transcriptional regulator [Bacteroidales bacterium]
MINKYYIERINKVIDYIEDNLDSKLLLDELAGVAMFSKYHFHRIFKNVVGENLNEFIKRMRMIKAYRFLQVDKTIGIKELAIKNGYNSTANFSRDFKEFHGISPSEARQSDRALEERVMNLKNIKLDISYKGIMNLSERYVLFKKITSGYDKELIPKTSNELYKLAIDFEFKIEQFIGVGYDDPDYTPEVKCKYDICIVVNRKDLPKGIPCESKIIRGGRFAVFNYKGHKNNIAKAWDYMFKEWLLNSQYLPDDRPHLEMYLYSENYEQGYFNVNLCLPVKSIN